MTPTAISKSQAGLCVVGEPLPAVASVPDMEMPASMVAYLRERRRAIITELRTIEQMLEMEPSIPLRERPH
jgi:hypothetical protein